MFYIILLDRKTPMFAQVFDSVDNAVKAIEGYCKNNNGQMSKFSVHTINPSGTVYTLKTEYNIQAVTITRND